jgi:hypothetical protein
VLRSGIYWTVSEDLLAWSPPALLWEAPLLWRRDCAAPAAFAYPSLIDGDAASMSFEDVDEAFWLYLTEAPLDGRAGSGRGATCCACRQLAARLGAAPRAQGSAKSAPPARARR